jgi:hypothetical protein
MKTNLYRICCYASNEVPILKNTLLLSKTLVYGNYLNALLFFCLIKYQININKIAFVFVGLCLNFLLYLILKKRFSDNFHIQIIEERKMISSKQNIKYQFVLLFIIFVSIIFLIMGMILGFELR